MSLYVTAGRGAFAQRKVWIPGDPGTPTTADTKQELIEFSPKPDPSPCTKAECRNMRYVSARGHNLKRPYWYWSQRGICMRCENLRLHHGLELTDLIALWEQQDRRCYRYPSCPRMLTDPRFAGGRLRKDKIVIDHDHTVCPLTFHSCDRCRRGLACHYCNVRELSITSRGMWTLPPEADELARWLEFLGPEDRDRLRAGLTAFPEQPARRVPRRRSPSESNVVPLFDLGA